MQNFVKLIDRSKLSKLTNRMKNLLISILLLSLTACGTTQNIKYSVLEKAGIHKRDILVDRIEKTSEVQEEAKEDFQSAYERLSELVGVDDAGLESQYKKLQNAVDVSENRSNELQSRIASVDSVAKDLFAEWREELTQYTSANLRRQSENNLKMTEQRYAVIYRQMQNSYARVQPVLQVLQDNTLYLKHNLNARAISGITNEVLSVEDKVAQLIVQMEKSIRESKQFIDSMGN